MSETERKSEENESSSDEEPPPGELDKPIVILYNKRAKKEIKRFEASSETKEKSKTEKKETIVSIPNGKGQSLETMSEVVKNFASESDKDLKVIFEVLFGHKKVKLNDVRKHLRKWNGWDVDPDSQEHHELQEGIGSMTTENIKWAMDTLDISRRGLPKKEDLVDKFCEWCMKPEPFGKNHKDSSKSSKKTPPKKSPTKATSNSKDEKPKKERKRKPEKDPNKPKKPQTAFLLFLNKNRVSFNEEAGTKNPGEIGKLASEKWKALSDDDKEPFIKEAEKAKAAYDIEIKEYNENKTESPPKKPKKEESAKKTDKKSDKSKDSNDSKSNSPKVEKSKVEKKSKSEPKSKNEKSDSKSEAKSDSKKVTDSDKPMLALEKGKLVSKGSKKSSKPSENGTSSKKVEKKSEKKIEKSKTEKSKSTEKNEKSASPKKPKNTIIIPNEKQIEKFLVKLIKQSNLEQLTMKQVLAKVAEKYPDMNVSSKKSFIKTKVKELIQ